MHTQQRAWEQSAPRYLQHHSGRRLPISHRQLSRCFGKFPHGGRDYPPGHGDLPGNRWATNEAATRQNVYFNAFLLKELFLDICSVLQQHTVFIYFQNIMHLFKTWYESTVHLHCCISFSWTVKWISYTHAYIHSLLDSLPTQVITEYRVEFPVLSSRLLLVICFTYQSVKVSAVRSHPTLCDPMDCSPPGSSDHGILQARVLEWLAMPFSRGSSRPRAPAKISCIAGRLFTIWATGEAPFNIYSSGYISISIFQFIPPPPYPLVIISLFSPSVGLFLFCR